MQLCQRFDVRLERVAALGQLSQQVRSQVLPHGGLDVGRQGIPVPILQIDGAASQRRAQARAGRVELVDQKGVLLALGESSGARRGG